MRRTLLWLLLWLTACAPAAAPVTALPASATLPPASPTPPPPATLRPTFTLEPSFTPPPSITPPPSVTPFPLSPAKQRYTFNTEDGRELVGYFYPAAQPNRPVVVFMHQNLANQTMWMPENNGLIPWLQNFPPGAGTPPATPSAGGKLPTLPAEYSFNVFTFDFRGHGESGGASPTDFAEFILDARAAYALARTLPRVNPQQILGLGTSIGADAVVDACEEGCVGAFSISPGSYLGTDYAAAAGALLNAGKLVRCMYSNNDGPSPATCWSVAASDRYEIFSYPGIKHGMDFLPPRKMPEDFAQNLYAWMVLATR